MLKKRVITDLKGQVPAFSVSYDTKWMVQHVKSLKTAFITLNILIEKQCVGVNRSDGKGYLVLPISYSQ